MRQGERLTSIAAVLLSAALCSAIDPPSTTAQGFEIVGWYVMMGIRQVVILRVLAEKLRDTNRGIEQTAWDGYRTEAYPTYDFKPVWDAIPDHRP